MKKFVLVGSVVGLLVLLYGGSIFFNTSIIKQKDIKEEPIVVATNVVETSVPLNSTENEVVLSQELIPVTEENSLYEEESDVVNYSDEESEITTSITVERGNIDNIPQGQEQPIEGLIPPVDKPSEESKNDITIIECDPEKGEYRFYDKDGNLIKIEYFEPEYKITL